MASPPDDAAILARLRHATLAGDAAGVVSTLDSLTRRRAGAHPVAAACSAVGQLAASGAPSLWDGQLTLPGEPRAPLRQCAVKAVLSAMRAHRPAAGVQRRGCAALRNLARGSAGALVVEGGALPACLQLLEGGGGTATLCHALRLLATLGVSERTPPAHIARVVAAALHIMRAHWDIGGMVTHAVDALHTAVHLEGQGWCVQPADVAPLVRALAAHVPDVEIATCGLCVTCTALCWREALPAFAPAVLDAGGVLLAVRVMEAHPSADNYAVRHSLTLLNRVAMWDAEGRVAGQLLEADAVPTVVRTYAAFAPGNVHVAVAGTKLFVALLRDGREGHQPLRLRRRLVESGLLPAVVRAITEFCAACTELAKCGCSVLATIARVDARSVCEAGAVPAAVHALQTHRSSLVIAFLCCSLLVHIACADGGALVPALMEAGGLRAVLGAMERHAGARDQEGLAYDACLTLGAVCASGGDGCDALVEAGGVSQLAGAVLAHAGSRQVCAAGCRALALLAEAGALGRGGEAPARVTLAATRALAAHPDDADVRGAADALLARGAAGGGGGGVGADAARHAGPASRGGPEGVGGA